MNRIFSYIFFLVCSHVSLTYGAIYTYEDVELRRIFPSEFPQDVIRRSGSLYPDQLARYKELVHYFESPKSVLNKHPQELSCYQENGKKVCRLDRNRLSPEEDQYLTSNIRDNNLDRNRVYCFMLICFTEDELERVLKTF